MNALTRSELVAQTHTSALLSLSGCRTQSPPRRLPSSSSVVANVHLHCLCLGACMCVCVYVNCFLPASRLRSVLTHAVLPIIAPIQVINTHCGAEAFSASLRSRRDRGAGWDGTGRDWKLNDTNCCHIVNGFLMIFFLLPHTLCTHAVWFQAVPSLKPFVTKGAHYEW